MPSTAAHITSLASHHNRTDFSCGIASLDHYITKQAGQDTRRDVASVYVATADTHSTAIQGYYTLCAYGVRSDYFPPALQAKLPRYDTLPAYLIGRLAVDARYKGTGLGGRLLMDALSRCVRQHEHMAAMAVIVDAINEEAANFYRHFDFQPFPNTPQKLFVSMKVVKRLFA